MSAEAAEDPGFFSRARVAILGLGLMGGSLALALRGRCAELIGIDPDPAVLDLASCWKLADRLDAQPARLLPEADILVLAAPVRAILRLLEELPALHPGAALVLDLGSTKGVVLRAMDGLPERFDPIGGHPMCGKERSSLREAEAGLYHGAPFALVPLPRTTHHARLAAEQLVRAAGARPLWLDAPTHDRWVAATSHLPYLVSSALAAATPLEAAPLAGPGFQSTTRLAAQPPALMLDVLSTNRDNVLAALQHFRTCLDRLESLLETSDFPALQSALAEGAAARDSVLENT